MNKSTGTAADDRDITHFTLRIAILSLLLTISGLMFIGIGAFRYTPHPIMHNVCAKGLTVIMGVLMLSLPWLAPRIWDGSSSSQGKSPQSRPIVCRIS